MSSSSLVDVLRAFFDFEPSLGSPLSERLADLGISPRESPRTGVAVAPVAVEDDANFAVKPKQQDLKEKQQSAKSCSALTSDVDLDTFIITDNFQDCLLLSSDMNLFLSLPRGKLCFDHRIKHPTSCPLTFQDFRQQRVNRFCVIHAFPDKLLH
jgi:hypothetical protein